ncbi:NAD(P)H-dependent flavin oxidoreductase [Streptacidiphilus monticola]|uniref:Propionate 3-nitronate monooxygenase n=1 Tax=Streptacidiphilus monticola TaxID=2161674 RepID=A0ABW1GCS7_9ACTN
MGASWSELTGTQLPVVAAPMAGGATVPALVAAVRSAGGFGFLAAGYKAPEAVAAEMTQLREAGVEFGVNLFAPHPVPIDEAEYLRYAEELAPEAAALGVALDTPLRQDDDHWAEKVELLLEHPVPVVGVTFGLPPEPVVRALQRAGSRVLATVTSVAEAEAAVALGVDALVAQGTEAGAHSGVHDPASGHPPLGTAELLPRVVAVSGLPVLAAGGIGRPEQVRDLVAAGAAAVMVGTALLRTDESGASRVHQDALADPRYTGTVVTRAFTGRPARGLRNGFIERHQDSAPLGYPAVHHLTRGLRTAAPAAGDADRLHLWAGTGYREARTGPAAAVVDRLAGLV